MIALEERIKTRFLETVYHGPRSYSEDEIGRENSVWTHKSEHTKASGGMLSEESLKS